MNNLMMRRFQNLIKWMEEKKIECVALNAGQSLRYLTGLDFHVSERPAILLVSSSSNSAFFFPEFESEKLRSESFPFRMVPYKEDPSLWVKELQNAFDFLRLKTNSVAVEPTAMRYLELDLIRRAAHDPEIISGQEIFSKLRIIKDDVEIQCIKKAIEIAQDALSETLPLIQPGVTEKEIANALVTNLLKLGSDPILPFSPIVASGPNSANPHAVPSDREMETQDMLIIDWGASYHGYISDITRTFAIKEIRQEMVTIYDIVKHANLSAREIKSDLFIANQIDSAARSVIQKEGYGKFFTHRTGHGIGLESHEEPYITETNQQSITPGMTFTIEPGIYLPDQGGVRIEDDICAGKDRLISLTTFDRELKILG